MFGPALLKRLLWHWLARYPYEPQQDDWLAGLTQGLWVEFAAGSEGVGDAQLAGCAGQVQCPCSVWLYGRQLPPRGWCLSLPNS